MTCIKRFIGYKSQENQTLFGRNRCLTPSHSVTQLLDFGHWLSRSSLIFVCFGQNVTRTTSHVNIWQIVTKTQSYVTFRFSKYVIFIQSMKRTIQSCICIYSVFLIFCIEKITGDSIPLTQKERFPKRYPNICFEGHFFWSRSLTPLFHVNIFPRKPKSTKPQCSKEARNACMRFKGFCSSPCFSLDVRISLKPPRHNQGIECRE